MKCRSCKKSERELNKHNEARVNALIENSGLRIQNNDWHVNYGVLHARFVRLEQNYSHCKTALLVVTIVMILLLILVCR